MKIFKKDPLKLQIGNAYAVQTGDYAGEMLVYISTDFMFHKFLSIPLMKNRNIPKDKFIFGMNNHIIEYVERVPKQFLSVIEAQYQKNENSNN
jgi:hypothetical protein